MKKLSTAQIQFLKKVGVPISDTFDASGLKKKEYRPIMKDLGKTIAYGVTPCASAGHTMRTRAGHCVMCNSANISYLTRFYSEGYVYVAYSPEGNLSKVGFANDIEERIKTLNYFQYGEHSDWIYVDGYHCENAGEVEHRTHEKLNEYLVVGKFYHSDVTRECTELFQCDKSQALAALEGAISELCEFLEE